MQRFQKKQPSVFKENSEITNQTQGFHISFEFITAHLAVLFVKWGGCFINVALLCRLLVLDARTPSQTQLTTENVIKKIQSVSKSFGKKGNHGQIVGLELANHGLVAGCWCPQSLTRTFSCCNCMRLHFLDSKRTCATTNYQRETVKEQNQVHGRKEGPLGSTRCVRFGGRICPCHGQTRSVKTNA